MGIPINQVARGDRADNVLNQITEYYGFVFSITTDVDQTLTEISGDTDPDLKDDESLDDIDELLTAPGRWLVDLECLEAAWFDRVWAKELRGQGGAELEDSLRGTAFEQLFVEGNSEQRNLLYRMHAAYLKRELQKNDEAPVSLFHVALDPDQWGRKELREAGWYRFYLGAPETYHAVKSMREAVTAVGVHTELPVPGTQEEIPPTLRRILNIRIPEGPTPEILRALHFPQLPVESTPVTEQESPDIIPDDDDSDVSEVEAEEGDPIDSSEPKPNRTDSKDSGDEDPGPEGPQQLADPVHRKRLPELARKAEDWLRSQWDRIAEWLRPPGPPLLPAGLGCPVQWRPPEPRQQQRPHPVFPAHQLYIGAPGNPRMANPMVQPAGLQEMVAILNIGQGNSNQLCDSDRRVICYYDYGSPLHNYLGTAPNVSAGCLHDDPLMVLSHWDYDHYSMARRNTYAYKLRWVVPQQHMGSAASGQVYARILQDGGSIRIWGGALNPAVERMALPWGFLQRGTVRNQLGAGSHQMNDGGIVMYVCVQDAAPGAGPGPLWPAAFGASVAPVPDVAAAFGLNCRAALANAMSQDIAQAAGEAIAEAIDALLPPWLTAAHIGAAANAARVALVNAGGGANWVHAWAALQGIGGGNAVSTGANLVVTPGAGGVLAGTTSRAAFAAAPGLLGGANLNAGGGAGITNTKRCVAAAAITDAAMARLAGNMAAARAAARAAMRAVMTRHVKAPVPAPAPPGYPAGAGALAPVNLAPVFAAAAQYLRGERYILLTGDVAVNYIPAQIAVSRPVVVGLTPTHHGARTCFPQTGSRLKRDQAVCRLPWAPGSPAAAAGYAAKVAAQDGTFQMNDQDNVRAAIVAAAAAYALKEARIGAGSIGGAIRWSHLAAAATNGINNPGADGRANLLVLGGASVGAAGTALRGNLGGGATTARAAVRANRAGLANTRGGPHSDSRLAAAVIVADVVDVVAGQPLGPNLEHTAIGIARRAARVMRFALNNPPLVAWAAPAVAAPRTVGLVGGNYAEVPSAAVRAAVRPWRSAQAAALARRPHFVQEGARSGRQAGVVVVLPQSGKAVYSYGITAGGAHLYPSGAGGFGHPHPLAVLEYEARGWFDRYNTPALAHASNQPYAPAPPGGARGNPCAMGWDVAGNQPLTGGGAHTISRTQCELCAEVTNNC